MMHPAPGRAQARSSTCLTKAAPYLARLFSTHSKLVVTLPRNRRSVRAGFGSEQLRLAYPFWPIVAAANSIQDEALSTGNGFSGLLGLAPQANSIVAESLDKTESYDEDGATFIEQIFPESESSTLTTPSPHNKFVSLLLERPYYPGVSSKMGIGAHPTLPNNLSVSNMVYNDITPTNPGPLYWRLPLSKIALDLGGTTTYVTLPGTQAPGLSSIYPIAVLDSGGVIMYATRTFANVFYGQWSIGPGKDDGQCKSAAGRERYSLLPDTNSKTMYHVPSQ